MKRHKSGLTTSGWLGLGLLLGAVFAPDATNEVVRTTVGVFGQALKLAAASRRQPDFGVCVG